MKALMLLFSVGISFAAFAQTKQDFQPNYDRLKDFVHPVPAPAQKNMKTLLKHLNMQVDSARYVASNHLGEIYTLPQDNMPMLKPYVNGAAPMPGAQATIVPTQPNVAGKIPNAVPEKKLVLPAPPARK